MGLKDLFKKAHGYFEETARLNKAYYKPKTAKHESTENAELSNALPLTDISTRNDVESLMESPDFEEVRAPWMVRVYNLEEELSLCKNQLLEKENECQKLNQQLNDSLEKATELSNMLLIEKKTTSRLESDLEFEEFHNVADQLIVARRELYDLFSQTDSKKAQLSDLNEKLAALEKELTTKISKRTAHEQISFTTNIGNSKTFSVHSGLRGESMNDFINRAIQETMENDSNK